MKRSPQGPADDGSIRVLVVDDNPVDRETYARFLERDRNHTYEVIEAGTAEAGLALARSERPACILLDYGLPDADGIELIEAISDEAGIPAIPVVVLTGQGSESIAVEVMKAGIRDYVVKGDATAEGLTRAIQSALTTAGLRRKIRRQREELESLHQQNELILNSAGEGICGLDARGVVTFANPAAAYMLGREVEELIGEAHQVALRHMGTDGTPCSEGACPIQAALEEGGVHPVKEDRFGRQDGSSFPVGYTSTPIRDRKAGIVGAVVTFRDISEQKELERQLLQAKKLEAVGQLATGIAHEINTPTQYVGDNLRFLQDAMEKLRRVIAAYEEVVDASRQVGALRTPIEKAEAACEEEGLEFLLAEVPSAIAQSLEGIERVSAIVKGLNEFAHPCDFEKIGEDLNQVIRTTIEIARSEWRRIARVEVDLDPELPPVPCHPGASHQVFLNMIVNATHAIGEVIEKESGEKGIIAIRSRRKGEFAEVRISDTGAGISEEVRNRVFDSFFTTKEVGKGTGQGLAIAHSVVVERHGGSIHLETEIGKGTTFIIRLPLRETQ